MRACPRRRTASPAPAPDAGFTLVETIVAIGIVGIVMMALTTFFVNAMRASGKQTGTQAAVQVAGDAMERVRSLAPTQLTTKRDQTSAGAQWASPVAGVAPWLSTMTLAYDASAAAGAGATAPMPTAPTTMTLAGVAYQQHFYLGRCWQSRNSGGDCTKTTPADPVEFFRVVVAVTWPDAGCAAGTCSYVTVSLFSNATLEPQFNSDDQAVPPQVDTADDQSDDIGTTVSLQMQASGGTAPLNWISAEGLPPGLSMNTSGLISGRLPSTPGVFSVAVTVRDDYDLVNTAEFAWTVTALPVAQKPADQNTQGGRPITALTLQATGGSTPATWTATNLPSGLTLNASTGVVTGTPNRVGTSNVTAMVTDKNGNTSSTAFTWTVPPLSFTAVPAPRVLARGRAMTPTETMAVTGGIQTTAATRGYTWTMTGQPAGLSISAAGVISGTPSTSAAARDYLITVRVTDSAIPAVSVTTTFTWKVQ